MIRQLKCTCNSDKNPSHLFEFRDLSDEEFTESSRHFRVSNMNHFAVDVEIHIGAALQFTLESAAL